MGVRIIESNSSTDNYAVLYCSTTMVAFGPVFHEGADEAQEFLDWLGIDPRGISEQLLMQKYSDFQEAETERLAQKLLAEAIEQDELETEHTGFDQDGWSNYFLETYKTHPEAVELAWSLYQQQK